MTEVMSEYEFWGLVDSIGWGTKTTDCSAVKKHLLHTLTPEKMTGMRDWFAGLRGNLYDVVEQNDIEGVSDDGLSDLLAHIVGLGSSAYIAHLHSFDKIQERATKRDYTESFSYCIPDPDELECLEVSTYQDWANRAMKIYALSDDPELEDIRCHLVTICEALETLKAGNWKLFLEYELASKKALTAIEKFFEEMDKDMARLGYVRSCDMSDSIRNPHFVLNLFHDVKEYLET